MKPIKIDINNAAEIEDVLRGVNGDALWENTYSSYEAIEMIADRGEGKLTMFGVPKVSRAGAEMYSVSGDGGGSRSVTAVTLERKSTGWYLVSVVRIDNWTEQGLDELRVTRAQDALCIANLRAQYEIRRAA